MSHCVVSVHKGENPFFHPSLSFRLLEVSLKVCARQTTFPVAHSWWDAFIPPRDITSAVSHSALTCLLYQFMCLLLRFNDSSGTTPHANPICHWFTSGLKSISMSKMSGSEQQTILERVTGGTTTRSTKWLAVGSTAAAFACRHYGNFGSSLAAFVLSIQDLSCHGTVQRKVATSIVCNL